MTRVRIEDLPPKLRAQVEERAAAEPAPSGEGVGRGARGRGSVSPGPAYRCKTCGATFARYGAAAERCADAHHGARLEAILVPQD